MPSAKPIPNRKTPQSTSKSIVRAVNLGEQISRYESKLAVHMQRDSVAVVNNHFLVFCFSGKPEIISRRDILMRAKRSELGYQREKFEDDEDVWQDKEKLFKVRF